MGESIPPEVVDQLKKFNETLSVVEDALQPHLSAPVEVDPKMRLMDRARVDLMSLFAINSLYWILLCTRGKNPKENDSLTHELIRAKQCMERLKQLEERQSAPRLNRRVAAGFVRNALWEPPQHETADAGVKEEADVSEEPASGMRTDASAGLRKRSLGGTDGSNEDVVQPKKGRL